MKKVLLLAVASCVATLSFSQVRYGVQATGTLSGASTDAPASVDKQMKGGFGIGVVSEIGLSKQLSLRPSLNFLQKGNSFKSVPTGFGHSDLNTTLNYVEVPVLVQYRVPLHNASLFFAAGPSVGYGVSGKVKITSTTKVEGQTQTRVDKIDAFKSEAKGGAGLDRLDFSANALAGVEFKNGLFVNAGYLQSLKSIANGDGKYKNNGIHLTLGYWFK